ncbi:MAG: hypothetical protein RIQ88_256 [Actinomycetota bacterium]|jgi:ADP-ribose pyrophosphatase YjhB (NUDIX family)
MTSDIFANSSVDLVIFTVVNRETLEGSIWAQDLVSYGRYPLGEDDQLSLFVLTVAPDVTKYPHLKGKRILPTGPVLMSKNLRESARAVAAEKLGLNLKGKLRQLGVIDDVDRPNHPERQISFAFWAMVDFQQVRKYLGGKDQVGLELVNSYSYMNNFHYLKYEISDFDGVCRFGNRLMPYSNPKIGHRKTTTVNLPEGRILGFDHDEMVFYAWRAMRHAFDGKFDPFNELGINPLGGEFRLSELQEFQEVCRGEFIQRDLFRRMMTNNQDNFYIKQIDKTDRSKPGKPARLYSPAQFEPNPDSSDFEF